MIELSKRDRYILICLCLALATAAIYWPVRHFGFITFDDELYITENYHVRDGLTMRGLTWAFTTPLDQWMPVTWVARILEYQLFGLNAGAYHLVNLLFHVANTLLLFIVLDRMTAARWRSAMVAALFALHPLHVEPVAWVTGLKDVLSMFFGLLTIWAYARYTELLNTEHRTSNLERRTASPPTASQSTLAAPQSPLPSPITNHRSPSSAFYILTFVLFALALMSKPMMVTLPFVLLLLDYWPLGRTRWADGASGKRNGLPVAQLLKEKLPLVVLSAAVCMVTYWGQRSGGAVMSLERVPLDVRVANALQAYVRYIGMMVWPVNLAVYYPVDTNSLLAATMAAGVGLVGVTAIVIGRARREPLVARSTRNEPWLVTGWFWYLGTLVPVIGLVQVGVVQGMADRYTYVPLVGLFIMLCWSVPASAMERWGYKLTVCIAAVAALVVCAVLTEIEVGYWKDTETLFGRALNVTRGNWLAHNNLASASFKLGRVPEAIGHWERALQLKPDYAEAHNNLGRALIGMRRVPEAIGHWEQALRFKPDFAEAHNNLGSALLGLGQVPEAIAHYEQALRLKPEYAEAHNNLGRALIGMGRVPEAVGHWEQALRFKPDFAEAHNNLGSALLELGQVPEAIAHYEQALRIQPNLAPVHYNLGNAFFQAGRIEEAIRQYTEAVRIDPVYAEAHNNLGAALEKAGRVPEAIEHYEQVVRFKPDFTPAQNSLARLRALQ